MARRFTTSRTDRWVEPRPHTDAHQRFLTYGPVQPMDDHTGRAAFWPRAILALVLFWSAIGAFAWAFAHG